MQIQPLMGPGVASYEQPTEATNDMDLEAKYQLGLKMLDEQEKYAPIQSTGVVSSFTGGLGAGIDQTQALLGGAVGLAGSAAKNLTGGMIGSDMEAWGQETYRENMKQAQRYVPVDGAATFAEADSVSDYANWAAHTAGELIPTMATMLAGGGVGGAIGKQLLGNTLKVTAAKSAAETLGKKGLLSATEKGLLADAVKIAGRPERWGQTLGVGLGSTALESGGIYGRQVAGENLDEQNDPEVGNALLYGGIAGALDSIVPAYLLNKLGTGKALSAALTKGDAAKQSLLAGALKEITKTAPVEGVTEVLQGVLERAAQQDSEGRLDTPEGLEKVFDSKQAIEEFAAGMLGGTMFGGPAGAMAANQQNKQQALLGERESKAAALRERIRVEAERARQAEELKAKQAPWVALAEQARQQTTQDQAVGRLRQIKMKLAELQGTSPDTVDIYQKGAKGGKQAQALMAEAQTISQTLMGEAKGPSAEQRQETIQTTPLARQQEIDSLFPMQPDEKQRLMQSRAEQGIQARELPVEEVSAEPPYMVEDLGTPEEVTVPPLTGQERIDETAREVQVGLMERERENKKWEDAAADQQRQKQETENMLYAPPAPTNNPLATPEMSNLRNRLALTGAREAGNQEVYGNLPIGETQKWTPEGVAPQEQLGIGEDLRSKPDFEARPSVEGQMASTPPSPARTRLAEELGERHVRRAEESGFLKIIPDEEWEQQGFNPTAHGMFVAKGNNGQARIYVKASAADPVSVVLHESEHADMKTVLGESYGGIQRQFDRALKAGDERALSAQQRVNASLKIWREGQVRRGKTPSAAQEQAIIQSERLAYFIEEAQVREGEKPTGLLGRMLNSVRAWWRTSELGKSWAANGMGNLSDGVTLALAKRAFKVGALKAEMLEGAGAEKAGEGSEQSSFAGKSAIPAKTQDVGNENQIVTFVNSQQNGEMASEADIMSAENMPSVKARHNPEQALKGATPLGYRNRTAPPPKKTITAYKAFREVDGQLYPMFVGAESPLPVGQWLDATEGGYHFTGANGREYVPTTQQKGMTAVRIKDEATRQELIDKGYLPPNSKAMTVRAVAYRPGWHAGDYPIFPQSGVSAKNAQGYPYPNFHQSNTVMAEVQLANDVDYNGEKTADGLSRIPENGSYNYATNMLLKNRPELGVWRISGSMKINRILSRDEVNAKLDEADIPRQRWNDEQGLASVPNTSEIENSPRAIAQTAKPEFKKWFGNSAVVTAEGKPKMVFRGDRNFEGTSLKIPTDGLINQQLGVHFAADPRQTDAFTIGTYAQETKWTSDDNTIPGERRMPDGEPYPIRAKPGGSTMAGWIASDKIYTMPNYGNSDQTNIATEVSGWVFRNDPEAFVKYVVKSRNISEDQARTMWADLNEGRPVDLESTRVFPKSIERMDGDGFKAYANTYIADGFLQVNGVPWATYAANAFRQHLLDSGYKVIQYENTSGNEVGPGIDPTAYIVLDPLAFKAYTNKGTFGKDTNNVLASVPKTPGFETWRQKAPVIRADNTQEYAGGGSPAVFEMFHGTTHGEIRKFKMEGGNTINSLGQGSYFTTSREDASSNYAGEGPDLSHRIDREMEQISDSFWAEPDMATWVLEDYFQAHQIEEDVTDDNLRDLQRLYGDKAIREVAAKAVKGETDGLIMPVWVKLLKPFDMGPNGLELGYEYNPETDQEEGNAIDLLKALREVGYEWGEDVSSLEQYLMEDGMDKITAEDFWKEGARELSIYVDHDGNEASYGQFMQEVVRRAGFDGIIQDANREYGTGRRYGSPMQGVKPGTLHVVPFSQNQIKSSLGNSGNYSLQDDDITASVPKQQTETPIDNIQAETADNSDFAASVFSGATVGPLSAEIQNRKSLWRRSVDYIKRGWAPAGHLSTYAPGAHAEIISRDSAQNMEDAMGERFVHDLERAIEEDTGQSHTKLADADWDKINEALRGDAAAFNALSANVQPVVGGMRIYLDSFSKQYAGVLQTIVDEMGGGVTQLTQEVAALRARIKGMPKGQDRTDLMVEARAKQSELNQLTARMGGKQQLITIIQGNLGKWLNRSYRVFDDKNWYKNVEEGVLERAQQYIVDSQGVTPEAANTQIRRLLKDMTAFDSMEDWIREGKVGALDLRTLLQRKDIAQPILDLLGEYRDPRVNFAKSAAKVTRLVFNTQLQLRLRDIGLQTGWFSNDPKAALPPGMDKTITGGKNYEYLDGLITYHEVAQGLHDILGHQPWPPWLENIVQVTSFVKRQKTLMSPLPTTFRNYITSLMGMVANGDYSWKGIKYGADAAREYIFNKDLGNKRQHLDHITILGVSYDTPFTGELDALLKDTKLEDSLLKEGAPGQKNSIGLAIYRGWEKFNKVMTRGYQFGDDFVKIAAFHGKYANLNRLVGERVRAEYQGQSADSTWQNPTIGSISLRQGEDGSWSFRDQYGHNIVEEQTSWGTEQEARQEVGEVLGKWHVEKMTAERIRNTYMTYSMVGRVPRFLRKFPLTGTFVSFPVEVLRTVSNMARYIGRDMKDPELRPMAIRQSLGMLVAATAAYGAEEWARRAIGLTKEELKAQKEGLAPWDTFSTMVPIGRDEKNRPQFFNTGYVDLYSMLHILPNALNSNMPKGEALEKAAWQLAAPFIGWDITAGKVKEVLLNKTESGRMIWDPVRDSPTDQGLKITEHLLRGVASTTLLKGEKIFQAMAGVRTPDGERLDTQEEILGLFGAKPVTLDPARIINYGLMEFQGQKRAVTSALSRAIADTRDTDLGMEYLRAKSARDKAYATMGRKVAAAKAMGWSGEQVFTMLRRLKVDRKDANALVRGEVPKWRVTSEAFKSAVQRAKSLGDGERVQEVKERRRELLDRLLEG